jgi:hypothetical protein
MKSFSAIHILLLLILMLAYQCAGAQDFAVTVQGDTVRGKVKLMDYADVPKIQVTGSDGKKTTLTMYQTREVFYDSTIFRPQKGPHGYSFMKLMVDGYLSLYAFKPENQNQYDGLLLVKKDGAFTEVPNLTFKKAMRKFLEDCDIVAEKIESGQYTKKELRQIIAEYNTCIDNKVPAAAAVSTAVTVTESDLTKKWSDFERKVSAHADFPGKADAQEMISDITKRIGRGEKVPNFLIQGLRTSIKEPDLTGEMEPLLVEIQKL